MLAQMLWGFPTKSSAGGDPSFGNVSLLLHGDGANGSTTITDSSSFAKTVSVFGNADISTAQSKFGGSSIYFDGSGDYLSVNSSAEFDFGTGDFTLEAWVRYAGGSTFPVIFGRQEANTNMALQLRLNASALELVMRNTGGTGLVVCSGGSVATNVWTHVAASRSGTTARIFVDGVLVDSKTSSNNLTANRPFTLGVSNDTTLTGYFSGYIDEFRVTKSVARYTANFTPPTAAFPDN